MSLGDLRRDYQREALSRESLDANPIVQFQRWLQDAIGCKEPEPNAMTLATADAYGHPSARIVLLKGVDDQGFRFFTNCQSRKGRELAENPNAALVFFWAGLERQVCIAGTVSPLPRGEVDRYFQSRPRGSRLGAWASPQSQPVGSRQELEQQFASFEDSYPDENIPTPPHWGGYLLKPHRIEFWQGRPNRLHDRFSYTRNDSNSWTIQQLAP